MNNEISDEGSNDFNEEELEIELNPQEPEFLRGQTSKTGVRLSPVRVIKEPEGTLQRQVMNAQQSARERREKRQKDERQIFDNLPSEVGKLLRDPTELRASQAQVKEMLKKHGAEMLKKDVVEEEDSQMPVGAEGRRDRIRKWLTGGKKESKGDEAGKEGGVRDDLSRPEAGSKMGEDSDKNNRYSKPRPKRVYHHRPKRDTDDELSRSRRGLPIFEYRSDFLKCIETEQVMIVIGETGSGKTTQMTQYLLEAGFCSRNRRIGCTQPRRIAARSVTQRVADEMGVVMGTTVGYSIRFDDCTSPETRIKYMTDGMLLREALMDSELTGYDIIILDEAHERSIHTDVMFGLLKEIVQRRKDLKLIVTSATLDAVKFSKYFFDCKILKIPGRTFPVQTFYSKEPEHDYLEAALTCVLQIHLTEPPGDILIFLTGQEEIDSSCQMLTNRMERLGDEAPPLIVLPVYSSLPSDKQNRIFEKTPEGSRKCVVATNIAEASLTIDGIYYVVDPGFAKIKCYNPKLGMDSLVVAPISQASADQRKGRAGRTGPGKCFRLYTEQAYQAEMMPVTIPEIQRTNLANTVLLLKAMGINDLLGFDFMDPPPEQTLVAALETLFALDALNSNGLLTRLGFHMSEFPLEPQLSKMLLTSVDLCCSDEVVTIISMLTVQAVFYRPKDKQSLADQRKAKFSQPEGDHLTLLTVYQTWEQNQRSSLWCHDNFVHSRALRRARDVRMQLLKLMKRFDIGVISCKGDYSKVRKAVAAGFFAHAAKRDPKDGYRTLADDQAVYLHPSSSLFNKKPEYVVYHELILTSKEYMRNVVVIDQRWLVDVAPNFYRVSDPNVLTKKKRNMKINPIGYDPKDPHANEWKISYQARNLDQILR